MYDSYGVQFDTLEQAVWQDLLADESDEALWDWLRRGYRWAKPRLKKAAIIARAAGLLTHPPQQPALPPPPPPIVQPDRRRDPRGNGGSKMLEALGNLAAEADSDAEAVDYAAAMLPLALRRYPRAGARLQQAAPHLRRGLRAATRTLRSDPRTRPLIRALPVILRRTTSVLERRRRQGKPLTKAIVLNILNTQARRVLAA